MDSEQILCYNEKQVHRNFSWSFSLTQRKQKRNEDIDL